MPLISRFLILCFALMAWPVLAAQVNGLYQVREPITQQAGGRAATLQRAFDTLVLRLTGDAESLNQPAVTELRENPEALISNYAQRDEHLIVNFDPATTERSLREAGVSLWGTNRPAVLAWWLYESANETQLVGDGQRSAESLRSAAQHRGLPLRLPLADLGEQLMATPEALASNSSEALQQASERYDADTILAVHARESGSAWEAGWQLWLDNEQTQGEVRADNREALADAVMLAVSQYLAPRFMATPGETSDITLEVQGADISRFAELNRLLEPLGARLLRVNANRLVYQLNANLEQLRRQLLLARLHAVPADEQPHEADAHSVEQQPLLQPNTGTLLRYRW